MISLTIQLGGRVVIPQFRQSSAAGWHPSAFNRAPVVEIMEKEEGGETKETVGKQGDREG